MTSTQDIIEDALYLSLYDRRYSPIVEQDKSIIFKECEQNWNVLCYELSRQYTYETMQKLGGSDFSVGGNNIFATTTGFLTISYIEYRYSDSTTYPVKYLPLEEFLRLSHSREITNEFPEFYTMFPQGKIMVYPSFSDGNLFVYGRSGTPKITYTPISITGHYDEATEEFNALIDNAMANYGLPESERVPLSNWVASYKASKGSYSEGEVYNTTFHYFTPSEIDFGDELVYAEYFRYKLSKRLAVVHNVPFGEERTQVLTELEKSLVQQRRILLSNKKSPTEISGRTGSGIGGYPYMYYLSGGR